MKDILTRWYKGFFIAGLAASCLLSYALGREMGKKEGAGGVIVSSTALPHIAPLGAKPSVLGVDTSATAALPEATAAADSESKGKYVGSKNGTKYYTPGCPGANRIKPANYVWFQSVEDATLQGYSKGSC